MYNYIGYPIYYVVGGLLGGLGRLVLGGESMQVSSILDGSSFNVNNKHEVLIQDNEFSF